MQFKTVAKSFSHPVRVKSLRTYSICNLRDTRTHKTGLYTYDGNFAPRLIKVMQCPVKVASVKP